MPAQRVVGSACGEGGLPRTVESLLVVAIALHSCVVGVLLLLLTDWVLRFGGWQPADPRFFARQAGIFHVVLAAGYLIEYFGYRGVRFLVTAKCCAVCFLVVHLLSGPTPWAIPFCAALDGVMALTVILVHRRASEGRSHALA